MDVKQMLEHYKNNGERVDEVLFNCISKELHHLRTVIDQKNFSIDLIGNQKLEAQQENKRLREALESIGSKGYVSEGNEYADVIANECIAHARRALEGERHGPSTD